MNAVTREFRQIKKWPGWIYWFPALLLRLYYRLLFRHRIVDPHRMLDGHARGVIGLTWHNRLLCFPPAFPASVRRTCSAVISASRDGQYVADFVSRFGIDALRGSSSRGGLIAQRGAVAAIRQGKNVIFTPDGPRGPKYRIKPGPIQLASLTGAAIYPVMLNSSRHWQCRSWDNFQIPKPFSTITLVIGDPIVIPPGLTGRDEIERYREQVEKAMLAMTKD